MRSRKRVPAIIFAGGAPGGGGGGSVPGLEAFDANIRSVWKMNGVGPAVLLDATPNSFDLGLVAGSPTFGQAGKQGTAVLFDATTHFNRAAGGGGFAPGTESYVLNFWFNPQNVAGTNGFFQWSDTFGSTNRQKQAFFIEGSKLRYWHNNSFITDGGAFVNSAFQMVTIIRHNHSGTPTIRAFRNGSPIFSTTTGADFDLSTQFFSIGKILGFQANSWIFDEIQYWVGTDFGADDVAQNANVGLLWNGGDGTFYTAA